MQFLNEFYETKPALYSTAQSVAGKNSVNKLAPITTNILVNKQGGVSFMTKTNA